MRLLVQSILTRLRRAVSWLGFHPRYLIGGGAGLTAVVALGVFFYIASPPPHFPEDEIISVEEGTGLRAIAADLHRQGVVRSPFVFRSIVTMIGGTRGIIAGDYFFEQPLSAYSIATRVTQGQYNMKTRVVTIPEGYTVYQMAKRFDEELLDFDIIAFLRAAGPKEGRLFPDTYELQPTIRADKLVDLMHATFNTRIKEIGEEIKEFGKPLDEVIIMASILEREAHISEDRRKIADVLWRRIEIGMPLQVDVTFARVNGKNSYQLTSADLETDDPFNTYTRIGLPPGPIGNPGLDALLAAVTPIESDNLFFLADRTGTTYFSETFEEHIRKKNLYVY
ncbi:MAG: endolytic transglycosylase MltG [Candidatus Paceibacterota bacterium]